VIVPFKKDPPFGGSFFSPFNLALRFAAYDAVKRKAALASATAAERRL